MSASANTQKDGPKPWATVAESAQYEDCIIGNRAGLELLRSKIEEAIRNGSAELPEHITNSMRVVLVDSPANPEHVEVKRTWCDIAGLIGIFAFLLTVLAVFLIGVGTISGWWK